MWTYHQWSHKLLNTQQYLCTPHFLPSIIKSVLSYVHPHTDTDIKHAYFHIKIYISSYLEKCNFGFQGISKLDKLCLCCWEHLVYTPVGHTCKDQQEVQLLKQFKFARLTGLLHIHLSYGISHHKHLSCFMQLHKKKKKKTKTKTKTKMTAQARAFAQSCDLDWNLTRQQKQSWNSYFQELFQAMETLLCPESVRRAALIVIWEQQHLVVQIGLPILSYSSKLKVISTSFCVCVCVCTFMCVYNCVYVYEYICVYNYACMCLCVYMHDVCV